MQGTKEYHDLPQWSAIFLSLAQRCVEGGFDQEDKNLLFSELIAAFGRVYLLGVMDGAIHLRQDIPSDLPADDMEGALRWLANRAWDKKREGELDEVLAK